MQLADSQCCFCSRKSVLQAEATACARCKSVAHRDCLRDAGNTCPTCHTAWLSSEELVVYSRRCPSCGAVIAAARLSRCSQCGGQTAWDSQADYVAAQRTFHRRGVGKAVAASLALLAAAVLTALAVVVLIGHQDLARTSDEIGRDVADTAGRLLVSLVTFGVAGTSAYLGARQLIQALPLLRFV